MNKMTRMSQNMRFALCLVFRSVEPLIGEGFILLTEVTDLCKGVPPPFDNLKIRTSTHDMRLKFYRY